MKSINRKSCLAFSLVTLLSIGVFLGKGESPFIPSAAAQAAENVVELSPTNMPATNEAVAGGTSDSENQPARNVSGERVGVGYSQKVGADETVQEVTTVFGSSDVAGTVERAGSIIVSR